MAAVVQRMIVDVHTHVYLPRYAALLRQRTNIPRIISHQDPKGKTEERLVILSDEPAEGRPVGPQYWDRAEKLAFMNKHDIDISVVSTANPWLDFLTPSEAQGMASELNEDLEEYCMSSPILPDTTFRRMYGFGLVPLVPGAQVTSVVNAVHQIHALPHLRGVILGTQGLGKGLDDPALDPVWDAVEKAGLVVFIHPHYGVGGERWVTHGNGHVLPLALGFPFETATAATRLILSGVLDRFPFLRLLLAHSGGALPALSSRLASCITHDEQVANRLKHDARYYLGRLYYDAVAYGPEELGFLSEVVARVGRYESSTGSTAPPDRNIGTQRILFGTDNPFFPPANGNGERWRSVTENTEAIDAVPGWTPESKNGVFGANAIALFNLGGSGRG
ncbi:amidohydrolase 2 [Schizophyllum commune Loenen D]|nr:amidohydrolase 2 [Schizophyllum commune Loenen D]